MKMKQIPYDVARRIVAADRRGKLTAGYQEEARDSLEVRRALGQSMTLVWPRKHGQRQAEDLLARAERQQAEKVLGFDPYIRAEDVEALYSPRDHEAFVREYLGDWFQQTATGRSEDAL